MQPPTSGSDHRHDAEWLRSGEHINAAVCVALLMTIGAVAVFGDQPLHRMPTIWAAAAMILVSGIEWWSSRTRQRLLAGGVLMPVAGLSAALFAMATRTPDAFVWVLAGMFIVFMRLPLRAAQMLSVSAVLLCATLGWLHWRLDVMGLARILLSGLLFVQLLSVFFGTNRRISRELEESSQLLTSTLQSMAQGLAVVGPDGRIKLFNDKMASMLELPKELLAREPRLLDVARLQTERGDFGEDFSNVRGDARDYVAGKGEIQGPSVPSTYTRRTPDGRYLEMTTLPMPSGDVVRTYSDVTAHEQMNAQLQELLREYGDLRRRETQRSRERLIDALCMLSRFRDHETGLHIVRTQLYVRTLAEALAESGRYGEELSAGNIDLIVKAAPMHDLGKIGIPDHTLLKAGGHTPQETALMRTHAAIGESTLMIAAKGQGDEQSVLMTAARIAGGHHENWDGSGYPRGLKGVDIPLEARLMSLADVYDALTTVRPYKRCWTHEEASAEIHRLEGVKFDPAVVAAFDLRSAAFRDIASSMRDAEEGSQKAG
jgi:HD-GYP domain-containing protein (c-di-GMP phosphodiesterase class II)